jgi:hypothetical protein
MMTVITIRQGDFFCPDLHRRDCRKEDAHFTDKKNTELSAEASLYLAIGAKAYPVPSKRTPKKLMTGA